MGFALSLLSLVLLPVVILRMPADYFVGDEPPRLHWAHLHPALAFSLRLARNGLGLLLVLLGVAMLVLPGQGLLCILVGLGALDFPGKRQLEQRLVARPAIRAGLDWIRRKGRRPPFDPPDPPGPPRQPRPHEQAAR